jgi:putative holliday junction resolvase
MALPHSVIQRSGDARADRETVAGVVAEVAAGRVVVGLPLSLDGTRGPAARTAEDEVEALGERLGIPVEVVDERFTTTTADRSLAGAGLGGRARRKVVDQVAASVILQAWLDRHTAEGAR